MTLGPLEYTVIGFRKGTFDGSIAREIGRVVDQNIVRIVDAVFIDQDAQGNTLVLEIDAKEDPAFESFAPILQNRMGLFTPEDIETLAGAGAIVGLGPVDVRLGAHVGLTEAAPDLVLNLWIASKLRTR